MKIAALWVLFIMAAAILYSIYHSVWRVLIAFGVFLFLSWLVSLKDSDDLTPQERQDWASRQQPSD